jgi:hypothetical protein
MNNTSRPALEKGAGFPAKNKYVKVTMSPLLEKYQKNAIFFGIFPIY